MMLKERGVVQNGGIIFPEPLELPEGAEVVVSIELVDTEEVGEELEASDLLSLPFFGMWADREDMADSARWVREERQQWQSRATRQG